MKSAILSIGTELLFGQTVNSNAAFLSERLNGIGVDVMYHFTVGDNPERLKSALDVLFKDCDLVITTGGLGPTEDDLTKETICKYFDDVLELHEESLAHIEHMAEKRNRKLTENNYKQAYMPSKSDIFPNSVGTAPGFALKKKDKMIVSLPGPPREMNPMWNDSVEPYMIKMQNAFIEYKILRFFGIGESLLETKLLPIIHGQTDPTIATYAKQGQCTVRVTSKNIDRDKARKNVDNTVEEIKKIVGEFLYSEDGTDLNHVLGKELIKRNITFSACESMTGGLFASKMVEVPGISKVFDRSLVTYTWKSKMEELNVSRTLLEKYGAESEAVCLAMVRGLKATTGSDICISVTGVAGPDDVSEEHPAGNFYVGIIFGAEEKVIEVNTHNDNRESNRNYAYLTMANEMLKCLGIGNISEDKTFIDW